STGQIVACDPLAMPDEPPFKQTVPPGEYPVTVGVDGETGRVAMAWVRFGPGKVSESEMALVGDQQLAGLEPGYCFGYGVDAGTGCFMDVAPQRRLLDRMDHLTENNPDFNNYYDDVLAAEYDEWANHHPWPGEPHNCILFHSGWG